MTQLNQRSAIRKHFRQRRNALSDKEQCQASQRLLDTLLSLRGFQQAKHVSLYLANDGELSPEKVIQWCWDHAKQVYLPVLHLFSKGHLVFVRYTPDTLMTNNRYGIPEPLCEADALRPLAELDLILTPLVAFDDKGHRLGMGGGFYDRTLAPIRRDGLATELVGLAHDCQQVKSLPTDSWDIPLSAIVTPTRVISCT